MRRFGRRDLHAIGRQQIGLLQCLRCAAQVGELRPFVRGHARQTEVVGQRQVVDATIEEMVGARALSTRAESAP